MVPLLGPSLLSQYKGLGCSSYVGPIRIESVYNTSLNGFANVCRFLNDIFLPPKGKKVNKILHINYDKFRANLDSNSRPALERRW